MYYCKIKIKNLITTQVNEFFVSMKFFIYKFLVFIFCFQGFNLVKAQKDNTYENLSYNEIEKKIDNFSDEPKKISTLIKIYLNIRF